MGRLVSLFALIRRLLFCNQESFEVVFEASVASKREFLFEIFFFLPPKSPLLQNM